MYALTGKLALPKAISRASAREADAPIAPPAMPQTFILPDDLARWGRAVRSEPAARWALKTKSHLGKDLRIVDAEDDLVAQLLEERPDSDAKKYRLAQRYVHPPLLLW